MLQKQALFLRSAQLCRYLGDLLRAHDQVPQKLTLPGIIRDHPQLGEGEFPLFGKVMEQGARKQQAAVNDLGVQSRQKVCQPQHIGRVHQKAGQKTVVDALGRGNAAKGLQVPGEHGLRHLTVVRVLQAADQCLDGLQRLVPVNGGRGHQGRHIIAILSGRHADIGGGQLGSAPVLCHVAPDFHHLPRVLRRTHGTGIIPGLQIQIAGPVG